MLAKKICLLTIAFFVCAYKAKEEHLFQITGMAQGTTYHISYWATDSLVAKAEIDSVLAELDSSLSIYKPHSLINKFNTSERGIRVDRHLSFVVRRSIEIYEATAGKFDITVYPLVNAWGFGPQQVSTVPEPSQVSSLLNCIGSDKIKLIGNQLTKALPCVKIDVNGIAQGYSVDIVATFLTNRRIKNYLVEIGGELRVAGKKLNGEEMKIGIEGPSSSSFEEPVLKKIIKVSNVAVTTSGNYRKFIDSGGQRISHLMNPKTGYPIKSAMISVTVIAKDAITADGFDNAIMAMEVPEALAFAKKQKLEVYLIYQKLNGKLADTATLGFSSLLTK